MKIFSFLKEDHKKISQLFFLWLLGFFIISFLSIFYGSSREISFSLFIIYFFPLVFSLIIFIISRILPSFKFLQLFAYFLFFCITITSIFGITKTMDGSYASANSIFLFGLSFYTVSLGYILLTKKKITFEDVLFISNPMLVITGPIITNQASIKYKRLKSRIKYFAPFIIFGLFLLEVVSVPLTASFHFADRVDVISVVFFAIIFEVFIYSNFCGLSLIIYGAFGIFGYLVPLNFKQPFSSTTVMDFWKGWHRSLSNALKEFFYKPVRRGNSTYLAVFFVFIASALWHGTSINFILWGLLHFFTFSLTIFLISKDIKYLNIVILVFAIIFGRLLFLESDTNLLLTKLQFNFEGLGLMSEIIYLPKQTLFSLALIFLIISIEFKYQNHKYLRNRNYKLFRLPIFQVAFLILILLSVSDASGLLYPVYGQR